MSEANAVLSILEAKECFAEPGESNIVDWINPHTKKGWYSNETLEQVKLRYPKAEIVDFKKWIEAKAGKQHTPIAWCLSTEEQYDEMLNVLPPAAFHRGGFLVGEPDDHDCTSGQPRYTAYRRYGDKFYKANRPMTCKEFGAEMDKPIKEGK